MTPNANVVVLLARVGIALEAMYQARQRYEDQLAPRFGIFDFVDPDEGKLSALLAWMLDSRASHGQGGLFLRAFADRFELSWDDRDYAGATAVTEVSTGRIEAWNRRIDVLVTSGTGDKAVAIENKPWAVDQRAQVADYLRHLEADFPGKHRLIYLSGDTSGPTEVSIARDEHTAALESGRLDVVGYTALLPWLRQCRAECRADRVASFLAEFTRYIEKSFGGTKDVTEREELIRHLTQTPEALAAALRIAAAAEDLRQHLLAKLKDQLDKAATVEDWKHQAVLGTRFPSFSFRFRPEDAYRFQLEATASSFRDTYYGVVVEEAGGNRDAQLTNHLRAVLTTSIGRGSQSKVWAWWRYTSSGDNLLQLPKDWSANNEPWLQIESGVLAQMFVAAARKVERILSASEKPSSHVPSVGTDTTPVSEP